MFDHILVMYDHIVFDHIRVFGHIVFNLTGSTRELTRTGAATVYGPKKLQKYEFKLSYESFESWLTRTGAARVWAWACVGVGVCWRGRGRACVRGRAHARKHTLFRARPRVRASV